MKLVRLFLPYSKQKTQGIIPRGRCLPMSQLMFPTGMKNLPPTILLYLLYLYHVTTITINIIVFSARYRTTLDINVSYNPEFRAASISYYNSQSYTFTRSTGSCICKKILRGQRQYLKF